MGTALSRHIIVAFKANVKDLWFQAVKFCPCENVSTQRIVTSVITKMALSVEFLSTVIVNHNDSVLIR